MPIPAAPRRAALALVLLGACSDVGTAGGATTGSSGQGSTDASTGTTTTGSPTTGTSTGTGGPTTGAPTTTGTTEPSFDPPTPVCGNGYVEGDEECDDANDIDDDACNNACQLPCGLAGEVLALAPTAESELWVVAVAPAPDGSFAAVARQREIVADQEGTQTIGIIRTRVLRYGPDAALEWDILLPPADQRVSPVAAVADAAGDLYVAATILGEDGDDIRVVKLARSDGHVLWTMDHDGAAPMSNDGPGGLALVPDGDLLVSGSVADLPAGTDVWVRKLAAADGAEIWTTTWTGPGNGEYSVDVGGPIAVAPDGTFYVAAREYVEYNLTEAVLLKFPADGGPAEWVFAPLADGSVHRHGPVDVAVDDSGDILFAAERLSGAVDDFWIYKLGPDKTVHWQRALADYQVAGSDWWLAGARFDPAGGVLLGGGFVDSDKMAQHAWNEVWLARLDIDGAVRCRLRHRAPSPDLLPPSVVAYDVVPGPDGTAHVGGQFVDGEPQAWVGLFRPL